MLFSVTSANSNEFSVGSPGFPGGSDGKGPACNTGDLDSISGLGRSPGGGHGNPLQCSWLENPGDGSLVGFCLWASVYGIAQSRTRLKRLSSNLAAAVCVSSNLQSDILQFVRSGHSSVQNPSVAPHCYWARIHLPSRSPKHPLYSPLFLLFYPGSRVHTIFFLESCFFSFLSS